MQFWKKLLDHTCRIYTVTAMLFLLLNLSGDEPLYAPAFLRVFWFALSFALANVIYLLPGWSRGIRLFVHFCLVTAGAFVFLYLPAAKTLSSTASMKLIMLIVIALVYWLGMALYWMILSFARKAKPEPKKEYKSVFKK